MTGPDHFPFFRSIWDRLHSVFWFQGKNLIERGGKSNHVSLDQFLPSYYQCFRIHGEKFLNGTIRIVAQSLTISDSDEEKVERPFCMSAPTNITIADQPVVNPIELFRHLTQSIRANDLFDSHAGLHEGWVVRTGCPGPTLQNGRQSGRCHLVAHDRLNWPKVQ